MYVNVDNLSFFCLSYYYNEVVISIYLSGFLIIKIAIQNGCFAIKNIIRKDLYTSSFNYIDNI